VAKKKTLKIFFNCNKCPAYCCSYPRIQTTRKDIQRLADYFGVTFDKARKKYTKKGEEKGERILRHQKDHVYKSVCQFLDSDSRQCTIYEGRPGICREYPGGSRCGYYDFLSFERKAQEDPEFIPSA
jgi:Fe-S-cluster containining protein